MTALSSVYEMLYYRSQSTKALKKSNDLLKSNEKANRISTQTLILESIDILC